MVVTINEIKCKIKSWPDGQRPAHWHSQTNFSFFYIFFTNLCNQIRIKCRFSKKLKEKCFKNIRFRDILFVDMISFNLDFQSSFTSALFDLWDKNNFPELDGFYSIFRVRNNPERHFVGSESPQEVKELNRSELQAKIRILFNYVNRWRFLIGEPLS